MKETTEKKVRYFELTWTDYRLTVRDGMDSEYVNVDLAAIKYARSQKENVDKAIAIIGDLVRSLKEDMSVLEKGGDGK